MTEFSFFIGWTIPLKAQYQQQFNLKHQKRWKIDINLTKCIWLYFGEENKKEWTTSVL